MLCMCVSLESWFQNTSLKFQPLLFGKAVENDEREEEEKKGRLTHSNHLNNPFKSFE